MSAQEATLSPPDGSRMRWLLGRRRRAARVHAESFAAGVKRPSLVDANDAADGADLDRAYFERLAQKQLLLAPIGSPYARARRRWLLFLLLLTTFEAIYLPLVVAFHPGGNQNSFEMPLSALIIQWVSDTFFAIEIAAMFRTVLPLGPLEGSLVDLSTSRIARRYVRSVRFLFDAAALLPLDVACSALGVMSVRSRAAMCLRLNRLLHMSRIITYHGHPILRLSPIRRMVVFWSLFMILAHWVSCSWWVLRYEVGEGSGEGIGFNIDVGASRPSARVDVRSSLAQRYLTCFYWSVTTLLRVPFVAPITLFEQLFTCVVTLLGAVGFAFFNGEVTAIVRASLGATIARTSQINNLRRFLLRAHAHGITRRTAIRWATTSAHEEALKMDVARDQALLGMLPRGLRAELVRAMHTDLFGANCGLEGIVTDWAIAELVHSMWPAIFLPQQVCAPTMMQGDASFACKQAARTTACPLMVVD